MKKSKPQGASSKTSSAAKPKQAPQRPAGIPAKPKQDVQPATGAPPKR